MVCCLHNLCRGEWLIPVLKKLYCIFHRLEVYIDWSGYFYQFRQGLPARLEVQRSNILLPLYEVILEALGGEAVEPHVPLFFTER